MVWGEVGVYYRTVGTQLKDHVFRRNGAARGQFKSAGGSYWRVNWEYSWGVGRWFEMQLEGLWKVSVWSFVV